MTDSINSFDVFRKFFTKLNEFSKKSIELEFNSNEAFTKEQLIVPVIHELGYITEADDNMRLDLWPEVINHDNNFVDYAIQLNEKQANIPATVIPVTTAEYGLSKAARPFNSRLDKSKLVENGFKPLPDWKDAVKRYLAEANL